MTITPPLIILDRWQQAITKDDLRDWCALCDLIFSIWARAECDCQGTEIADDLKTLSDVAFERARMLVPERVEEAA